MGDSLYKQYNNTKDIATAYTAIYAYRAALLAAKLKIKTGKS